MLTASGSVKIEKRATVLLPSVNKLSKSQWGDIITVAKKFAFDKKSNSATVQPAGGDESDGDSDTFVLHQSDSDLDADLDGDGETG
jgi:hypothetical protein